MLVLLTPSKKRIGAIFEGKNYLKDLFSAQAELYARYRPGYAQELFDCILSFVRRNEAALDCATGNGQVARALSPHFQKVHAIDLSESQLRHAVRMHNIEYSVFRAEETPFDDHSFDLITVAQAYHWIDGVRFCREAARIGRPGAVVAIWGYDLSHSGSPIDAIVRRWNFETLAPYWEAERQHVYSHYSNLPFDFERIPAPEFQIVVEWECEELVGHMRTWSALQNMIRQAGDDAFRKVVEEIESSWGSDGRKRFTFRIFLKLGKVRGRP